MQKIIIFWKNFSTNPEKWFFYVFLLTLPFSIRKVLFFYPLNGSFNEYSGVYIYLSDIALIFVFISWTYSILYNNFSNLSNKYLSSKLKCSTWNNNICESYKVIIVPRGTITYFKKIITKTFTHIIHRKEILIPFLLCILSTISILSSKEPILALFKTIKLFELFLLYLFIIKNVPRGTFLKNTLLITIFSGIFQSVIGITQFIIQKSLGLSWLKESLISPEISGVAKIIFSGERFIRGYGTFPHPNIFGGFLLLTIISTYLYYKMFHVEHSHHNTKFQLLILIQGLSLFLTFSKSAIISLIIALFYLKFYTNHNSNEYFFQKIKTIFYAYSVKCSTWNIFTKVKKLLRYFLVIIIIFLLLRILKLDFYTFFIKSLQERIFFLNVPRGTFSSNPFLGIGNGQAIFELLKYKSIELWQFQPVHNIFLLIMSELGIVGLFLFVFFLGELLKPPLKNSKKNNSDQKNILKCSTWNNNICETYSPISIKKNPTFKKTHFFSLFQKKYPRNLNVPRGTFSLKNDYLNNLYFKAITLGFIFIMLFDHYFWTIQQGELLLWLTAGLIIGTRNDNENMQTYLY